MTEATADRAVDMMLRSPARRLKAEFQGGEPLLNFGLIRRIVERVTAKTDRPCDFVIATNLANLDDDMLAFCAEHDIAISTSLDGPQALHDANRPRPGGDAHARTVAGIEKCRRVLGRNAVAALMTTTARTL